MNKYAKAFVGAVVSASAAYGAALADGSVTGPEVGTIIGAFLAGLGFVYAVPNKPSGSV